MLVAIYSVPGMAQSGQDAGHDFSSHVGQSEVPALERKCQSRMVDTQQVKYGGVEVVNVHRVLDDVV